MASSISAFIQVSGICKLAEGVFKVVESKHNLRRGQVVLLM